MGGIERAAFRARKDVQRLHCACTSTEADTRQRAAHHCSSSAPTEGRGCVCRDALQISVRNAASHRRRHVRQQACTGSVHATSGTEQASACCTAPAVGRCARELHTRLVSFRARLRLRHSSLRGRAWERCRCVRERGASRRCTLAKTGLANGRAARAYTRVRGAQRRKSNACRCSKERCSKDSC